jgi:ABC-type multidrug transport system ATPase subunit
MLRLGYLPGSLGYLAAMVVVSTHVIRVSSAYRLLIAPPGKTTLFNLIQGHLLPDRSDPACNVFIDGRSIITGRNKARTRLGVCPQATALESVLTVREHLEMYARCKGLRGEDLDRNVECIMAATQLLPHSHKYANKLSGGNQVSLVAIRQPPEPVHPN